ncbi:MAG: diguanylate cyclase domain-containing protein [Fibrobacterota bacterium]
MKKENRLNFGVFLSTIEEPGQNQVWRGIEEYCRKNNIDVTAYISIFQQKTGKLEEHYDIIFDAIKTNTCLDGLIFLSGFIAEEIGTKPLIAFMNEVSHIPHVSIAGSAQNEISFLSDNKTGTYSLVEHLIRDCNCKKIAFVCGPDSHEEAQARFEGYREALRDNKCTYTDSRIIRDCQFSVEDGELAVQKLLDRKVEFDAIAAVDDDTAIGVLQELERRGISVPDDVLVGGFDNSEMSQIITPSLTTLSQPFFALGYNAAEALKQLHLNPDIKKENHYVTPELKKRESTGSIDVPFTEIATLYDSETTSFRDVFHKSATQHFIEAGYLNQPVEKWLNRIIERITSPDFDSDDFVKMVNQAIIRSQKNNLDLSIWRDVLNILLKSAITFQETIPTPLYTIFYTVEHIFRVINAVEIRYEKNKLNNLVISQWELRGLVEDIIMSFDYHTLTKSLLNVRDNIGINYIHIFLYEKPIQYDEWKKPETVNNILKIDSTGVREFDINEQKTPFEKIETADDFSSNSSRKTILYMPIFFDKEQNGILLLEYNKNIAIETYESLRMGISTAIKGAALIKEVQKISITDDLTGLYNRRGFLTLSYSRLARLKRTNTMGGLMFIDLDGLKIINDSLGHKTGDAAITATAAILKQSVREEDIIGRIGGDEFTIFASQIDTKTIRIIVKRIRSNFEKYNEEHPENTFTLSCSIGFAILDSYTERDFNVVLSKADSLLYEEKNKKRKTGISRK